MSYLKKVGKIQYAPKNKEFYFNPLQRAKR